MHLCTTSVPVLVLPYLFIIHSKQHIYNSQQLLMIMTVGLIRLEHWAPQQVHYSTYRPPVYAVPVDPNPSSCEQATFAADGLKPAEHTCVHSPSNCIWSHPSVELPPINLRLPRSLSLLFTTGFIEWYNIVKFQLKQYIWMHVFH